MPAASGIYVIQCNQTGKCYVGSSVNLYTRQSQHLHRLRRGSHPNAKLQNAWAKYGELAFQFMVLELVGEEKLLSQEGFHIERLSAVQQGYNISSTPGRGRAGMSHSAEALARMSEAQTGKVISAAHRESLSAAFKNRSFSDETRAKISAAKMGKARAPFSEMARKNMSAGATGRALSDSAKAKLSTIRTGTKMSDEARTNMSAAQKRRFSK
jgi:group I intron endonuclease